jgi:hypothetical protein
VTVIHIHRVRTHEISRKDIGQRWCFGCRRHVRFTLTVNAPVDPMSYYGPHADIRCENGHHDGDLFPGLIREWTTDPQDTQ